MWPFKSPAKIFIEAGVTFFNVEKSILSKGLPMDPATATQNAIASFFQFLASPEGQKIVEDFRQLDAGFIAKLKGLFDKINTDPVKP